jgi:hypothetical protein
MKIESDEVIPGWKPPISNGLLRDRSDEDSQKIQSPAIPMTLQPAAAKMRVLAKHHQ